MLLTCLLFFGGVSTSVFNLLGFMIDRNLKYLRSAEDLTQADFGSLFDASRGMIDTYEKGRAQPSHELICKVAKHFNISLDDMTYTDLSLNPGLVTPGGPIQQDNKDEMLKAKDEMIAMLKDQVRDLQERAEKQGIIIEKLLSK